MGCKYASVFRKEFSDFISLRLASGIKNKDEKYMLAELDRFLIENKVEAKALTENIILKWFHEMDVSPRTKKRKASAMRVFAKYLLSMGIEAFIMEIPQGSLNYVPYIFSEDEFVRIISVVDNFASKPSTFRYQAAKQMPLLIRILYGCGLRLQEALLLRWCNVNTKDATLFVEHAKNDKQRIVPMSASLARICEKYRYSGLCATEESDYLFSKNGIEPYSKNRIQTVFNVTLKEAGIEFYKVKKKERGPCLHCLRHLFVFHSFSQAESSGMPFDDSVPYLSTYLGHSHIMETDKYLKFSHVMFTDAHEAIDNYTKGVFPKVVVSE